MYTCLWYEVGGQKVRGTYEKKYAEDLLGAGIEFVAQPKPPLLWESADGKTHKYTPDFYLPGSGEYVEVTSTFALSDRAHREGPKKRDKLERVGRLPGVKLLVVTEVDLGIRKGV